MITDQISLTFHHCAFLNVPSKWENRHNQMCLTFLHYVVCMYYQMCPQSGRAGRFRSLLFNFKNLPIRQDQMVEEVMSGNVEWETYFKKVKLNERLKSSGLNIMRQEV